MWANADDQGRLSGDPEEIKYATCPNIDHITKLDIPRLLDELAKNDLIKVYKTSKTEVIQILDWWDIHRPQWAWPSQYSSPEGWQDHLRYKKDAKTVLTQNWPISGEADIRTQVSSDISSPESSPERSPENSPENSSCPPLTTPSEKEKEEERERRRGRGNSPENSGEKPSPSPTASLTEISDRLFNIHEYAFGQKPRAKEAAQLRDLSLELSEAGCPLDHIDQAFKEAAGQNKFSISYVRAILLDWLGVERNRSP